MRDVVFWAMAAAAILSAWRVFRADSMVRAAYWLMASFVGVGAIMVLVGAEFLGLVLLLMMAGEMTIMAVFMVMLMMNPAGLNPMIMVHQHRTAIAAGIVAFAGLGAVGLFGRFPSTPLSTSHVTAQLGRELLGDSMLIFETAGVTLLATMIGAIAIASRRGRYGTADEGSEEPMSEAVAARPASMPPNPAATPVAEDAHDGHEMGSASEDAALAMTDHSAMGHRDTLDEHEGHAK